ncbi:MAG: hypothetical protein LBD96_03545 [Treponema sp.]|jgi:hypothetical protein|nr:hypothetical protein [Treponema sp.]
MKLLVLTATAALSCFSCSTLSFQDLSELIQDLPRHSSSRYITHGSLPSGWFERAYATLDDPYVYIVLSDTGSPASRFISLFTAAVYNHVSLAFDRNLETLVSYNGGNGVSSPGLNVESLETLNQKAGASLAIYRLRLEPAQKRIIIERIQAINREGSSYNIAGLLSGKSRLPNIMFCSQFVYSVLDEVGLAYFKKKNGEVRPEDFIKKAEGLEFLGCVSLNSLAALLLNQWQWPETLRTGPVELGIYPEARY